MPAASPRRPPGAKARPVPKSQSRRTTIPKTTKVDQIVQSFFTSALRSLITLGLRSAQLAARTLAEMQTIVEVPVVPHRRRLAARHRLTAGEWKKSDSSDSVDEAISWTSMRFSTIIGPTCSGVAPSLTT